MSVVVRLNLSCGQGEAASGELTSELRTLPWAERGAGDRVHWSELGSNVVGCYCSEGTRGPKGTSSMKELIPMSGSCVGLGVFGWPGLRLPILTEVLAPRSDSACFIFRVWLWYG